MLDRKSELIGLARSLDERTFARRNPGLFLVLPSGQGEPAEAGRLTTVRVERLAPASAREVRAFQVFAVVRRESSPFEDLVSLGRADANDIILAHPTVSKVHAFFSRDPEDEGAWRLADQGSANGTRVEGVRLPPHREHRLRGDEVVAFGECHASVKDARALWRFLELVRRTA